MKPKSMLFWCDVCWVQVSYSTLSLDKFSFMMLNLSWLLLSPLLAPKFELGTRPQVIRVWNETELQHADLDDIFLCPKQTVSYLRKSSGWPKSDLYIDGRKCLRTSEIQAANSDRLECVAKVTGFTSELLSNLGLDAFITDGTLLGWFRHNGGQIPWDLDGDIGVLRSQCTQAVSDGGVEGISDIIKDKLPPGYFLYAIDEDHVVHSNPSGSEFKQCDVPELRVGSTVNDQWCHTDIYISIDDEDDICLRKGVCFKKDVLLPLKNSSLVEKFAVEVPARPEDVLAVLYRKHPGIMNMRGVPKNYLFQNDWAVVVGDELDSRFSGRVTVDRPRLYGVIILMLVPLLLCPGLLYILCTVRRRKIGFVQVEQDIV